MVRLIVSMSRVDKIPGRCSRPVQLTTPYVDDRIRNDTDDRSDKVFERFSEWGHGRIKREFRPTPVLT